MVQIIPRTEKTFGEHLSSGIGKGADLFAKYAEKKYENRLAGKAKEDEYARKLGGVEKLKDSEWFKKLSESQQGILLNEALGNISAQTSKSLVNAGREENDNNFLNNLLGSGNQGQRPTSQPQSENIINNPGQISQDQMGQQDDNSSAKQEETSVLKSLSDNQLDMLLAKGGKAAELGKSEKNRREKEKEFGHKEKVFTQGEKEFGHKETAKYGEKIVGDADRAREVIDSVNEIRKVISKKGAVGSNAKNLAFKYLSSKKSPFANLFQSEDTQSLINATKTLAGGGIKEIFSKPTEREFFWFENILPDILKDAPTNEKSARYFEKLAKTSIKKQEIYDGIIKKHKGYRPLDIDSQVRERMEPEMQKLVQEAEDLSEYVLMKDPKGIIRQVPKGEKDKYLNAGGVLIE